MVRGQGSVAPATLGGGRRITTLAKVSQSQSGFLKQAPGTNNPRTIADLPRSRSGDYGDGNER